MSAPQSLPEQIESALEGTTAGEWRTDNKCDDYRSDDTLIVADDPDDEIVVQIASIVTRNSQAPNAPSWKKAEANARFIASAPTLLTSAVSEIRAKDSEIARLREALEGAKDYLTGMRDCGDNCPVCCADIVQQIEIIERAALQGQNP